MYVNGANRDKPVCRWGGWVAWNVALPAVASLARRFVSGPADGVLAALLIAVVSTATSGVIQRRRSASRSSSPRPASPLSCVSY